MKKVKIRFIAMCPEKRDEAGYYYIQIKKWYGWRYLGAFERGGFGDATFNQYRKNEKEYLIDYVIEHHFKTTKQHIEITEYPELRKY